MFESKLSFLCENSKTMTDNSIKQLIKVCLHYNNSCMIKGECCEKFYDCHRCHDLQHQIGILDHKFSRGKLDKVMCVNCDTIQNPANKCINCNIIFAQHCCLKCALFNNEQEYYHCDDCDICRVDEKVPVIHCKQCNRCVKDTTSDYWTEAEKIHLNTEHDRLHDESYIEDTKCKVCQQDATQMAQQLVVCKNCKSIYNYKCAFLILVTKGTKCLGCNEKLFSDETVEKVLKDESAQKMLATIPKESDPDFLVKLMYFAMSNYY